MILPSKGIRTILVAGGIGSLPVSASTWPIYLGNLPDKPNNAIALFDGGGDTPLPTFLLDFPNVYVNLRSDNYEVAYDKMESLKNVILGLPPQLVSGDWWDGLNLVGNSVFLGNDEKSRVMFSVTFQIIVEPALVAGGNRKEL